MQDFQGASCLREAEAVVIGIGEAKHSKCSNCSNHFVINEINLNFPITEPSNGKKKKSNGKIIVI